MQDCLRVLISQSFLPEGGLDQLPPDSEEQQAALQRVAEEDAYNWGFAGTLGPRRLSLTATPLWDVGLDLVSDLGLCSGPPLYTIQGP